MGAKSKLLLVDDEPANLVALKAVLEDMGHELVTAQSGREALRCLMNGDFAVILLDVQMPTMDGFETAALIRTRERSRHTPIVFLTAVGRSENEMFKGYQVGAVDYMVKPFVPDVLRFKVAVLTDLQSKTLELQESNQALGALNATLEQRVQERTIALVAQGRRLAQSNEELGQFANLASHDLQEPLRSLSTYLYLLQKQLGPGLHGEARASMESALVAAGRMRDMITGLLAFSRLDQEQHRQAVDCGRLLKEVLESLAEVLEEKKARISAEDLPIVLGDPSMLRQLFQNLLDNALKFSNGPTPLVELGGELKQNEALLWVRDHGIGIARKDHGKLFKLFKRLHSAEEYPGSGLGLALCKKVVERHGGRLWLESEEGKGTTFYFTLPVEHRHGHTQKKALEALRGGGS